MTAPKLLTADELAEIETFAEDWGDNEGQHIQKLLSHIAAIEAERDRLLRDREISEGVGLDRIAELQSQADAGAEALRVVADIERIARAAGEDIAARQAKGGCRWPKSIAAIIAIHVKEAAAVAAKGGADAD